jgi:RNA polymerase sigma-70 factor (ECF subfamily)
MSRAATERDLSDEALMREVASGQTDAIGLLYARYAPAILAMASRAVGRPAAEEILQDVFVAVWKNASSFDPERGPVRPWLMRIARFRVANELRRLSRRPQIEADPDGDRAESLPDPGPDQVEDAWRAYRATALHRALEELPEAQRQALGLAFFEELTHDEVASALALPLGTAKSRIRAGLQSLRLRLAPVIAAIAGVGLLGLLALRLFVLRSDLGRDERALTMLTSSEAVALRLTVPGQPAARPHALYRFREGSPIVVMTFSYFAPPPAGQTYRAWAMESGRWVLIGSARPDAQGRARLTQEHPALVHRPEALAVTLEQESAPAVAPTGQPFVAWSPP